MAGASPFAGELLLDELVAVIVGDHVAAARRESSGPRSADAGFAVRRPPSPASLADLVDAT
jgi:hypothetical protein